MSKSPSGDDTAFIRALAELLRETDLSEIEVTRAYGEDERLSVRLTRTVAAPAAAMPLHLPIPASAAPAVATAPAPAEDPSTHPGAVASPMVGTVYLAPEPGAAAFVRVGDKVDAGQTVLIVEAMKTMNQIPAPRGGVVRRILVEDRQPVEYGAPLMIIE